MQELTMAYQKIIVDIEDELFNADIADDAIIAEIEARRDRIQGAINQGFRMNQQRAI